MSYEAYEKALNFTNESAQKIQIVFRVFDEGVAFRYVFLGTSPEELTIESELTGFNVGVGFDAWMSPYQAATSWGKPGYEVNYLAVKSGMPST